VPFAVEGRQPAGTNFEDEGDETNPGPEEGTDRPGSTGVEPGKKTEQP